MCTAYFQSYENSQYRELCEDFLSECSELRLCCMDRKCANNTTENVDFFYRLFVTRFDTTTQTNPQKMLTGLL